MRARTELKSVDFVLKIPVDLYKIYNSVSSVTISGTGCTNTVQCHSWLNGYPQPLWSCSSGDVGMSFSCWTSETEVCNKAATFDWCFFLPPPFCLFVCLFVSNRDVWWCFVPNNDAWRWHLLAKIRPKKKIQSISRVLLVVVGGVGGGGGGGGVCVCVCVCVCVGGGVLA